MNLSDFSRKTNLLRISGPRVRIQKAIVLAALFAFIISPAARCQGNHKTNAAKAKQEGSVAKSIVLLNNTSNVIPLMNLENRKVAAVNFGYTQSGSFKSMLAKYAKVDGFDGLSYTTTGRSLADLSYDLKYYNTIILQLTENSFREKGLLDFIRDNLRLKQVILMVSGNSILLEQLNDINAPLIWTDNSSSNGAAYSAQVIFGGVGAEGTLSKAAGKFRKGEGDKTAAVRLKYTVAEELGINSDSLEMPIDRIMKKAISQRGTPGAVIMVVKNGKVIFDKAYGTHTYVSDVKTTEDAIFDMASVTKTTATTPSVMHLVEQGILKLDTSIAAYIPKTREAGKAGVTVRQVMLHEAGFIPFIPFFRNLKPGDMSRDSSAAFPVKAAENVYMRKGFFETVMWPQMLNAPLKTQGQYVYSDFSMYYMQQAVEQVTGTPLEQYVQDNFYKPLGMQTAGFLPLKRFSKDRIVPTEKDTVFRMGLVQGYVHDPGAAMAGGVAGHAGLFATADDLAIFYQLLLNGGTYGGRQYFKPETVKMFTSKQSQVSRRGLGFDRMDPESKNGYPSKLASPSTFGHTGYTGIGVWADPEKQLIYIFLSNRVHPDDTNMISRLNVRSDILDVIYRAVNNSK